MREKLERARLRSEGAAVDSRYELRGNNLAVQTDEAPELLLVGAAGTGKTLAILIKLDRLMREYPGARALVVRKVRADLAQTTLVTWERDVLGLENPICKGVQREHRHSYRYPNGSEVVVGGMDRPGNILSSEYDFIYPAEAVQFDESDWEFFVMRNRNYVIPFQQVVGDTNPAYPTHWLKLRCDAGRCQLLPTFHEDNPAYWDAARGEWTARGRDYVLGKLNALTGVRRARFKDGKWVLAEGAVYDEWNEVIHVVPRFEIPSSWRRIRVIDFGYNNPFVCHWWAVSPDDVMVLYREIYMSRRIVEDHAAQIRALSEGERIEATVADHDAEDRATLERHGVKTIPARKEISVGIAAVKARLRREPLPDGRPGKPRLLVFQDALVELDESLAFTEDGERTGKPTCTRDEFPAYVWAKAADGRPVKEVPLDLDNHGMDCARYAVRYIDQPRPRGAARARTRGLWGGNRR